MQLLEAILCSYSTGTRLMNHITVLMILRTMIEAGKHVYLDHEALAAFARCEGDFEACLPQDLRALIQAHRSLSAEQEQTDIEVLIS